MLRHKNGNSFILVRFSTIISFWFLQIQQIFMTNISLGKLRGNPHISLYKHSGYKQSGQAIRTFGKKGILYVLAEKILLHVSSNCCVMGRLFRMFVDVRLTPGVSDRADCGGMEHRRIDLCAISGTTGKTNLRVAIVPGEIVRPREPGRSGRIDIGTTRSPNGPPFHYRTASKTPYRLVISARPAKMEIAACGNCPAFYVQPGHIGTNIARYVETAL